MITQPIQPMDTPRDPHLPPPAVVDWLLEQKWSDRIPSIEMTFPEGGAFGCSRSSLNGYHEAHTAIGRDETARLFMPDDALDALRKDQDARQSALSPKWQECEADELRAAFGPLDQPSPAIGDAFEHVDQAGLCTLPPAMTTLHPTKPSEP
jgi:hypothetical protein